MHCLISKLSSRLFIGAIAAVDFKGVDAICTIMYNVNLASFLLVNNCNKFSDELFY